MVRDPLQRRCVDPGDDGDSVDRLLADWHRERDDLDFAPVGVVTRLARVRAHLDAGVQHVFDRYDLSSADFIVIVSLRRAGRPFRLPQVQLARRLGLTSGTLSVRIDRLVKRGVVVREESEGDRRVTLVRLTTEGLRLFDEIAPVHLDNEDRLLSALDAHQREQLGDLMRQLLITFEQPRFRMPELGLELLEAHAARERRRAVGLSDPVGLLVAAPPDPGSPGDHGGLRQGDLLMRIGGTRVHSGTVLAGALAAAAAHGTATLEYLRGESRHQASLDLGDTRR